ncbi:hypothetical protein FGO68_gene10295 [Halteria grandinella]|uniref:Uncharacterized protein n=1 Tax=Halteria grandinella TaxID=5974 RepID=A0A8J8NT96_HALGN|nr:hypothetical protein FGO68_gene10295 [Halteria grandinella]
MTASLNLLIVSARAEDTYPINLTTKLEDRILGDEKGCSLIFNRSFIDIKSQLRDKLDEIYIDDPDHDIMEYLANITVNGLNENSTAKIIYNRNKFLDSGHTSYRAAHDQIITTQNGIDLLLSVVDYSNYNSLSSVFYKNIPDERIIFFDSESIAVEIDSTLNQTQLNIQQFFLRKGVKYTRSPQNIFSALAKISGLQVLLQLSIAFLVYHRHSFRKQMKKGNSVSQRNPINESESSLLLPKLNIEERFSYERIEENIEKVQDISRQLQSLQLQQQSTQNNIFSQGGKLEKILEQNLPEKVENFESSVFNLQQALQKQQEQAHRQQEQTQRQQEQDQKLQAKQCEQILELQEVNRDLLQIIREMQTKLQALEESSKN